MSYSPQSLNVRVEGLRFRVLDLRLGLRFQNIVGQFSKMLVGSVVISSQNGAHNLKPFLAWISLVG